MDTQDLPISAVIPGPKNEANFACQKRKVMLPIWLIPKHDIFLGCQLMLDQPVFVQNQTAAEPLPQTPKQGSICPPQ